MKTIFTMSRVNMLPNIRFNANHDPPPASWVFCIHSHSLLLWHITVLRLCFFCGYVVIPHLYINYASIIIAIKLPLFFNQLHQVRHTQIMLPLDGTELQSCWWEIRVMAGLILFICTVT